MLGDRSVIVQKLRFEWLSFLSAMGLMSRIPIGPLLSGKELDSEHHNRSQIWYPWVGAVLGLLMLLWLWVSPESWVPLLSAAVLVVIWVSYTGALHLDGLADSVDAWVGGMNDPGKTLSIMKDPTSGPMAVVALVLVLLLKVALVAEILSSSHNLAFLFLVPLLARAWLLPFLYKTPYARDKKFDAKNVQTSELASHQGCMATDIASNFPSWPSLISFLASQVLVLILLLVVQTAVQGLWVWLVLNLSALTLCILLNRACVNRVGGYTGDVLGAFIELQEVVLLLGLAASVTVLI